MGSASTLPVPVLASSARGLGPGWVGGDVGRAAGSDALGICESCLPSASPGRPRGI